MQSTVFEINLDLAHFHLPTLNWDIGHTEVSLFLLELVELLESSTCLHDFVTVKCWYIDVVSPASMIWANIIRLIGADTEQSASTPGMYQLLVPSPLPPDGGFKVKVGKKKQLCLCHSVK